MTYLNEHLWIGQGANLLLSLAFVAALFSAFSFFLYVRSEGASSFWLRRAKILFFLHLIAITGVFFSLFIIIYNHYFEYAYAYQHSDLSLDFKYILSCFWEGQEGSFLLWIFWNAVLGALFLKAKAMPVYRAMPWVLLVQLALCLMISGIWMGSIKIGSNPFALLRNELEAPVFSNPDYLSLITDGRGLNALLQNYWMVIHPPVLFLGFSAALFPFALCMGALCFKSYRSWTKWALPWGVFAAGVLGLGILLGAAWAYESLTFGGYWAWDPVENASLVPWLLLVAAIHTNLIYKRTQRHLNATILFYILAFLLVLYATYLTRSGVLGEGSVHSFTDLGMGDWLLGFLLVFVLLSAGMYGRRYKGLKKIRLPAHSEAHISSREFYMFLGSVILLLSGLIISTKTSLPVFNKIFNTRWAPPQDEAFSYNSSQILTAFFLTLLSAWTMFLKYIKTDIKKQRRILGLSAGVALILLCGVYVGIAPHYFKKGIVFYGLIGLTLFVALFSVVAHIYWLIQRRGHWLKWGPYLAHLGFALLLAGILISASGKKILSWNTGNFSPLQTAGIEKPMENLTLIKNKPAPMGDYDVTYLKDSSDGIKVYYHILFQNKYYPESSFILRPDVIKNTKGMEGVSPNPDAYHYWHKDIFVYLTYIQLHSEATTQEGLLNKYAMAIGDTLRYGSGYAILDTVSTHLKKEKNKIRIKAAEMVLAARFKVVDTVREKYYWAEPLIIVRDTAVRYIRDTVSDLVFDFRKVQENNTFEIGLRDHKMALNFITLKVYEFPFINLLWIGTFLMTLGFGLSFYARIRSL